MLGGGRVVARGLAVASGGSMDDADGWLMDEIQ